jgi:hypothetical protein
MRDTMIFYRSFYEAIKELEPDHQQKLYNTIFEYGLDFKEPEVTGICKTDWTLIKPQLDANLKRFENGSKPKVKQVKSETEAKQKQEESKTEANNNNNNNNNVNNNKKNNKNILLDFSFCNENLVEDLKSFVEFRKSIKKPFTTQDQLERLYKKLRELSGGKMENAKKILDQSIVNGWQGVFELKETPKPKQEPNPPYANKLNRYNQ